jgi:hypothetical protein
VASAASEQESGSVEEKVLDCVMNHDVALL